MCSERKLLFHDHCRRLAQPMIGDLDLALSLSIAHRAPTESFDGRKTENRPSATGRAPSEQLFTHFDLLDRVSQDRDCDGDGDAAGGSLFCGPPPLAICGHLLDSSLTASRSASNCRLDSCLRAVCQFHSQILASNTLVRRRDFTNNVRSRRNFNVGHLQFLFDRRRHRTGLEASPSVPLAVRVGVAGVPPSRRVGRVLRCLVSIAGLPACLPCPQSDVVVAFGPTENENTMKTGVESGFVRDSEGGEDWTH